MPFDYLEGGQGEEKTEKEKTTNPILNALVEEVSEAKKSGHKHNKPSTHSPVEVKTTTGDCDVDESWNARMVVNTVDQTFKVFSNGAWQTVHSW